VRYAGTAGARFGEIDRLQEIQGAVDGEGGIELAAIWYFFVRKWPTGGRPTLRSRGRD